MLKYFWIAEYKDGTALPQFDPDTGKEYLFKEINQSKVVRFSLYPFTFELSRKVNCSIANTFLPIFNINLNDDDKLYFRRRNYIERSRNSENRYIEYLLGIEGKYIMHIDEFGNTEIKKE